VRLYYDDPLLLAFDARVTAHGTHGGRPSIILDRTAFYPESGGQMADRGLLGGLPIVDVHEDEQGVVHHLVEGERPAVGTEVRGEIDRTRRRLHMALHTGQHMLSRALLDVARGETVSSRLGETVCTIDLAIAKAEERDIARAEELVNSVVEDDVAVRAFFPDPKELAALPLRRPPKVETNIRVVQIGDFDVSPCGGTHCLRTAQVGLVRVIGIERYKGMIRVSFHAGRRAREELARESDVLRGLGRELTCGPAEVPLAITKLRRELGETRESLGHARERMAVAAAEELMRSADGKRVIAAFEDADSRFLRAVAKRVTSEPGWVALVAGTAEGGMLMLAARAEATDFDCGAFIKRAAQAGGGRGGGRAEMAEGRLPAPVDWKQLVGGLLTPS
jgi:alanyl-tRNA synthetase